MNLKEAEIFLEEVKVLYEKIPEKEKTFMEISGYPHYENVCSNILSFYLNSKEEHKMKDIVLKTLLKIVKKKEVAIKIDVNLSNMNVFREYITEDGNRIDIVLQNDEIAIGIENKVMAGVYNDLKDYANTIEKINNNAVKVLLSLHDESSIAKANEFINITYNEFFDELKINLMDYEDIKNKWYIYLIEFIKTLEGVKLEKDMEEEINEWVKNHQEDINHFYELLNLAQNNMNKKLNEYGKTLEEKVAGEYKVKYWNDNDIKGGAFILLGNLGCNLDAFLTINGWSLGLNLWRKSNQTKIKQALRENQFEIIRENSNNHIYLFDYDYDCPINEIVDKAKKVLDVLILLQEKSLE